MNPTGWGILISGVATLGTVLGVVLSRLGKKGDQEAQSVTDQFNRMLQENAYLTGQVKDARSTAEELARTWEGRWERQMRRCREITDAATHAIIRLVTGITDPGARAEADRALRDIRDHNDSDHP